MTTPIRILSGRARNEPVPGATAVSASSRQAPMRRDAEAHKVTPVPASALTWENSALAEINQILKMATVGVQFEFDRKTDTLIAKVVDVETGKLIREMPSEEVRQLSKALGKLHDLLRHQAICRKAQASGPSQAPAPLRWSSPWVTAMAAGQEAGALRSVKA